MASGFQLKVKEKKSELRGVPQQFVVFFSKNLGILG